MAIPLRVVESILLKIPNSELRDDLSTKNKKVFKINQSVIIIPVKGISTDHLREILNEQLEMSWWHIDYIFGQNGIR